jgi:hypothetical protein
MTTLKPALEKKIVGMVLSLGSYDQDLNSERWWLATLQGQDVAVKKEAEAFSCMQVAGFCTDRLI